MAPMRKFASVEEYLEHLHDWQRPFVDDVRERLMGLELFDEGIKWGNLVFFHRGPCMLVHAEEDRMLVGFWRGKRLVEAESRIVPSGKYELGNIELTEGEMIAPERIEQLAKRAARMNELHGDPTNPANYG